MNVKNKNPANKSGKKPASQKNKATTTSTKSRKKEKAQSARAWGGRLSMPLEQLVQDFTCSVRYDCRLAPYDVIGSLVHATMLYECDIINEKEFRAIQEGLVQINSDIQAGKFVWREELEDVHMNIEMRLVELVGEPGKKLHTARSRNDQVATAMRIFVREACDSLMVRLCIMRKVLVAQAKEYAHTIMPGFTHLQNAQAVTFGHHLLAWAEMLERDFERLWDCRKRVNICPLGAAALAGTSYPIDRYICQQALGFSAVTNNSIDAVSDRDFILEFNACASFLMIHLSRMSEEVVLWCSEPFGFITLDDAFCSGSSIMPQKKNPDVAELVRGRAGRVCGNLMAMLMVMKGQPLSYNRDNQEDKKLLFDCFDTTAVCLDVWQYIIADMQPEPQTMYKAAAEGYTLATDVADYLVRRGTPFRDAHKITGRLVNYCEEHNLRLEDLTLAQLQKFSSNITEDIFDVLSLEASVAARSHVGGTAPDTVKRAAAEHGRRVDEQAGKLDVKRAEWAEFNDPD